MWTGCLLSGRLFTRIRIRRRRSTSWGLKQLRLVLWTTSVLVCLNFGPLCFVLQPQTTKLLTNFLAALTPFHSDDVGTLYTSATARSTRTFGYTYPEVVDWNVTATQLSSNVRANVNNLYNPTNSISKIKARSLKPGYSNTNHKHTNTINAATDYQYFINIRVNKYILHPHSYPESRFSTNNPTDPLSPAPSSSTSSSVPSPPPRSTGPSPPP